MNSKLLFNKLEEIGRIQLSENFFLREFLTSEIAIAYNLVNIPKDLDLAIEAGTNLCEHILEPLQLVWGRIHIRSAYRSEQVNHIGNLNKHNCASNFTNHGAHIWDVRDSKGYLGASACIVIPKYLSYFRESEDWVSLAWWIHHNIPDYTDMCFFKHNCAFNVRWSENPVKQQKIKSFIINKDTGDKSQLVNKGISHNFYTHIDAIDRYKNCMHLLKH